MTNIEHDEDAGLADVTAECGRSITGERTTVGLAVIGLTNFASDLSRARDWPRSRASG